MTEMVFEDLEKIYDLLARSLDQVGEDRHALFLARLVMILAHKAEDREMVEAAVAAARKEIGQAGS